MPNKKKKKGPSMSMESRHGLSDLRQSRNDVRHTQEKAEVPLPASRPCKPKVPSCPVCPECSDSHMGDPCSSAVPSNQGLLEADVTISTAKMAAIRSRPILQAVRRFSYHHRKLSLSAQRRPQSLGSGLRAGLFRRHHPTTLPQHTETQKQHSASKLKLSTYLRRAKQKFRKSTTHVPLIRRPIGNRILSCIQLEKSTKQLACGSCGERDLILEENSNRYGWATYIRWKCRQCEFATDWTSSSPRVTPKGAFEVSTIMNYKLHSPKKETPGFFNFTFKKIRSNCFLSVRRRRINIDLL